MGEFRESLNRLFSRVEAEMKAAVKKRERYLALREQFIDHVVVPTLNEMSLEMQEHNRLLEFAVSAGQVMGSIESPDGIEFSFIITAKEGLGELSIIEPGLGGPTRHLLVRYDLRKEMPAPSIFGQEFLKHYEDSFDTRIRATAKD